MHPLRLKALVGFTLLLTVTAVSNAQHGTSSMAMGIGRAGVSSTGPDGQFRMPAAELFRVEEMVNYHQHKIPVPTGEHRVHFDIQQMQLDSGKSVLQLGLATPTSLDSDAVAPLNLVLVIDQSGSMSGERIDRVKEALHALVKRLRKQDKVTLVGFGENARVHLEATNKTKVKKIRKAIDNIRAGGSTNLHAGLMLGYQQASYNYDAERTNRVILLTDGRVNTGEVDLNIIASDSKAFNQKGIDLSTIGLGNDLNHQLLRQLADAGRGLIHFVSDATDIEKTFVAEVQSLLAPAARKVKLIVDLGSSVESVKVYGYTPTRAGNKLVLKLDDLNHGATQVLLIKTPKGLPDNVSTTLRYRDAISGEVIEQHANIGRGRKRNEKATADIQRNYAIAIVADSIKRAAAFSNQSEYSRAAKRLRKGIQAAEKLVSHNEDEHLNRIIEIAANYETKIRHSLTRNDN